MISAGTLVVDMKTHTVPSAYLYHPASLKDPPPLHPPPPGHPVLRSHGGLIGNIKSPTFRLLQTMFQLARTHFQDKLDFVFKCDGLRVDPMLQLHAL